MSKSPERSEDVIPTASLLFLRALVHALDETDPALLEKVRQHVERLKETVLGEEFPRSMEMLDTVLATSVRGQDAE